MQSTFSTLKPPRIWIGHWLIAVAALHTLYAGLVFGNVFLTIGQRGLINGVGLDPLRGVAVWFLLFGVLLAVLGLAIVSLERSRQASSMRLLGWCMLFVCVLGIALMPASGFWLALPPTLALIRKRDAANAELRNAALIKV